MILNVDLGEGEPAERTRALMQVTGAANVACGGHAGSDETMRRAVRLAKEFGVRVGAHPGLAAAFGRGVTDVGGDELEELVVRQVGSLAEVEANLHHVKLHGALYHAVERNETLARRYCGVVAAHFPGLRIFALAGGTVERVAEGIDVFGEVFAERGYTETGGLVPRGMAGDLLEDVQLITQRVADWQRTKWLGARTVCVHSDSPGAVEIAKAIAGVLRGKTLDRRRDRAI